MLRNKAKRFISLGLILVLTLAVLAGCNGATTGSTTAAGTKSSTVSATTLAGTTASTASSDRYGKYDKEVKVTLLQTDPIAGSTEVAYDPSNPDRASANKNRWISSYKQYLNIAVERIIAEDGTALNAKINTAMASGDLPDIMIVGKNMFYTLFENGTLADISNAYKTYSSTNGKMVKKVVESASDDSRYSGTIDGKWLGLPFTTDFYNSSDVLWVRQDWLDKVGLKVPTTIDDMVKAAKAFKDAKLGGEKTLGLGLTGVSPDIVAAYGVVPNTWQKQTDGKYAYTNTLDGMKKGLLELQKIYKDGLIKSDFAVTNILDKEIANSIVGMYYAPAWNSVTSIKANLTNDPSAKWVCTPIPSLDGKAIAQSTNADVSTFLVVNKKCKNPEALFKLLEFELHMYYEPTDKEAVDYFQNEDGYLMWNLRPFRNYGMTSQDLYRTEITKKEMAAGKKTSKEVDPIISVFYDKMMAGKDWNYKRELVYEWGLYYVFCVGYPMVVEKRDANLLVGGYNGPITNNIQLYQKTINETLNSAALKVVMGADISVYDDAIKAWYASGGQAITDDVNAYYKNMK